jgi:hypothetical protein
LMMMVCENHNLGSVLGQLYFELGYIQWAVQVGQSTYLSACLPAYLPSWLSCGSTRETRLMAHFYYSL